MGFTVVEPEVKTGAKIGGFTITEPEIKEGSFFTSEWHTPKQAVKNIVNRILPLPERYIDKPFREFVGTQKLINKLPETMGSTYERPHVNPPLAGEIKETPISMAPVKMLGELVTSPTSYLGLGLGKKLYSASKITLGALDNAIEKGVSKGIKPTVIGKPTLAKYEGFFNKANTAVKTIAENKNNISLVDDAGEVISHPRSAAEMAQAIDQTKKVIYKKYHDMAIAAGDKGAQFSVEPVLTKLDAVASDLKYSPEVREYADGLKRNLTELHGQSPEVVEARIADLNNSLAGYYDNRVVKAKAQVDASVANLMREELDNKITGAVGEGYQKLKRQYGSLKQIEKEVNKRALVNARQANKSLTDLTDIFTGADLAAGIVTLNPALIARGIVGRATKEAYKKINKSDSYIEKMFKEAYKEPSQSIPYKIGNKIGQAKQALSPPTLGKLLTNQRGSIGESGNSILKRFEDKYDPRRLTKSIDEYLNNNISDISQLSSAEQGVGTYKNNIVFKLKNGEYVYLDSPNNTTSNLIKINNTDNDLILYDNVKTKPVSLSRMSGSSAGRLSGPAVAAGTAALSGGTLAGGLYLQNKNKRKTLGNLKGR